MEYIVYALFDPKTDIAFYVGSTRADLADRLRGHIGDKTNVKKKAKIAAIIKAGRRPGIKELERSNEDDVHLCERRWIGHFLAEGVALTNMAYPEARKTKIADIDFNELLNMGRPPISW